VVTPKGVFMDKVSGQLEERVTAHIEDAIRRARSTPIFIHFEVDALPSTFDMSPIMLKYAAEGWELSRDYSAPESSFVTYKLT
jgi:hypothetical protein